MNISIGKIRDQFPCFRIGDSCKFLEMEYSKGFPFKLKIGDEVIIHPVPNISQATRSYMAKVSVCKQAWIVNKEGRNHSIIKLELRVEGIGENKKWHGAILNEYAFNRLEFVRKGRNNNIFASAFLYTNSFFSKFLHQLSEV